MTLNDVFQIKLTFKLCEAGNSCKNGFSSHLARHDLLDHCFWSLFVDFCEVKTSFPSVAHIFEFNMHVSACRPKIQEQVYSKQCA